METPLISRRSSRVVKCVTTYITAIAAFFIIAANTAVKAQQSEGAAINVTGF